MVVRALVLFFLRAPHCLPCVLVNTEAGITAHSFRDNPISDILLLHGEVLDVGVRCEKHLFPKKFPSSLYKFAQL